MLSDQLQLLSADNPARPTSARAAAAAAPDASPSTTANRQTAAEEKFFLSDDASLLRQSLAQLPADQLNLLAAALETVNPPDSDTCRHELGPRLTIDDADKDSGSAENDDSDQPSCGASIRSDEGGEPPPLPPRPQKQKQSFLSSINPLNRWRTRSTSPLPKPSKKGDDKKKDKGKDKARADSPDGAAAIHTGPADQQADLNIMAASRHASRPSHPYPHPPSSQHSHRRPPSQGLAYAGPAVNGSGLGHGRDHPNRLQHTQTAPPTSAVSFDPLGYAPEYGYNDASALALAVESAEVEDPAVTEKDKGKKKSLSKLSAESSKLLKDFGQILQDIGKGVPAAYGDLERLVTTESSRIENIFNLLPPRMQKTAKTLAKRISKKPKDGEPVPPGPSTSKGPLPGFLKFLDTGMLVSLLSKIRVPPLPAAALSPVALASVGLFVVLCALWYCCKRGREIRLAKDGDDLDSSLDQLSIHSYNPPSRTHSDTYLPIDSQRRDPYGYDSHDRHLGPPSGPPHPHGPRGSGPSSDRYPLAEINRSRSYDGVAEADYHSSAYHSRHPRQIAYDSRSFDSRSYDSRSFDGRSYDSRSVDSRPHPADPRHFTPYVHPQSGPSYSQSYAPSDRRGHVDSHRDDRRHGESRHGESHGGASRHGGGRHSSDRHSKTSDREDDRRRSHKKESRRQAEDEKSKKSSRKKRS